jgi:hypothetical protein
VTIGGGGIVQLGALNTYTGGTSLGGTGILEIAGTASAGSGALSFTGTGATLQLDATTQGSAVASVPSVAGFVAGDTIDLRGISPGSVTFANGAGTTADNNTVEGITVDGTFAGLLVVSDDNGGADIIVLSAPAPPVITSSDLIRL